MSLVEKLMEKKPDQKVIHKRVTHKEVIEKNKDLYGIPYWSSNYFNINSKGHVEVTPEGKKGPSLDLFQLSQDLKDRGIRTPMLVRFSDIVKARIQLLFGCFRRSIKEYGYKGEYLGVYPIKVNQQRYLLDEILNFGKDYHLGLECGSKSELLIALAYVNDPKALIICNGFKDSEYIETALLSQKLNRNTIIVVDRLEELGLILKKGEELNLKPQIGLRVKLSRSVQGQWGQSVGMKSKFGLTPSELVKSLHCMEKDNKLNFLKLIHFHLGSQIPSIQSIKMSLKEAVRFYSEVYKIGARPLYIDVGGGLGVDYDGSGASHSSTNYSEQEYANDVVSIIQSICEESKTPCPHIISESGRSMVAHSSVLIFDVLGVDRNEKLNSNSKMNKSEGDEFKGKSKDHLKSGLENESKGKLGSEVKKDSLLVQELLEIFEKMNERNINEFYNDLIEKKRDILQLFSYGLLSLKERAKAEDLYWASVTKMVKLAEGDEEMEEIYLSLKKKLTDTYFGNFSVFQSLPDSWVLDHIFPVLPIHRLNEPPTRQAKIVDLTCDSDGKIDDFINMETHKARTELPVHEFKSGEPYYIGVFLTGAYQEILGDLHNLFGDTDAVHVSLNKKGYHIKHVVRGDSVETVLNYVQFQKFELLELIRKASEVGIQKNSLTHRESRLLMKNYEKLLSGYTYFD